MSQSKSLSFAVTGSNQSNVRDSRSQATTTVTTCYDILDVALSGGISDFTDGMYGGDRDLPYEVAQARQAEWLLDQIGCQKGFRFLDVGCGNGRLLAAAKARGAEVLGITISKRQLRRNEAQGLPVQLLDYRNIPHAWSGRFDGIVANGSIEHFVQVDDAIAHRQDEIYRQMFQIFGRLLKSGGRVATTVIHFAQPYDADQVKKGSSAHPKHSDLAHLARVLLEDFGGWYPLDGQLRRCASPWFTLERSEDGTQDYRWTSETWLKVLRQQCSRNPQVWSALALAFLRHPRATMRMMNNLLIAQSWMWQFRPRANGETPTNLRRDVWQKVD